MNRAVKVVFLHNVISPHNVPLFSYLAKAKTYRFKFLFLSPTDTHRPWTPSLSYDFDYEILRTITFRLPGQEPLPLYLNLSVWSKLRQENPDIIVISGWDHPSYWLAAGYAQVFGKKLVLWSGSTASEPSWRRTLTLPLVKMIIKSCAAFVAYGTRAREYLLSLGASTEKVFVSSNTTDIDFCRTALTLRRKSQTQLKKKLGFSGRTLIMFYGQLIDRKGPLQLLQAFSQLAASHPELGLMLVGNGPLASQLQDYIQKSNLTKPVRLFPYPGEEKIVSNYAAADIFILPSRQEVWGLVVNQAMAAGLPVITTAQTGASVDLIMPGQNGLIIPDNSPAAIVSGISQLLTADLQRMGKASSRLIRPFHPSTSARSFLKALDATSG